MQITRIDFKGSDNTLAQVRRKAGSPTIEATILTPEEPNGVEYFASMRQAKQLWSMAESIQLAMDGERGTGTDIGAYFRAIEQLAD